MDERLDSSPEATAAAPSSHLRSDGGLSALSNGAWLTPWRLFRLALGLVLGLALLVVAARGIDLAEVRAGLAHADPLWVILAFLTVLLTTAAKVARWRWLFPKSETVRLAPLTCALLVGQLTNALLPARVGEVARAYVVGREHELNKAMALGTIAAEKAFDVLLLLVCAGVTASLASLPQWLDASLIGMAAAGLSLLAVAVLLPEQRVLGWIERRTRPERSRRACGLLWNIGGWLCDAIRHGLGGLAALRQPRIALAAIGWSAVVWTFAAATNYLLFWAFDLQLSIGAALLLLTLLHVGMAPPSSPGRLGVFHALTILGLRAFHVDRASGLAYATVLHAVVYLPQILLGCVALGLNHGALRALSRGPRDREGKP